MRRSAAAGIVGDSLSASIAITVAASDIRVSALVLQVPACGIALGDDDPDGTAYAARRESYASADVTGSWTLGQPQTVVSENEAATPSLSEPITACQRFRQYGLRPDSTWRNTATPATVTAPVPFSIEIGAGRLTGPSLWVIAAEHERLDAKRLAPGCPLFAGRSGPASASIGLAHRAAGVKPSAARIGTTYNLADNARK